MQERFNFAGWLAILSALITIPKVFISVITDAQQNSDLIVATLLLDVLMAALWVYVFLVFIKLLNSRFGVDNLDTILAMLIWFTVFSTASGFAYYFLPAYKSPIVQVSMLLSVLFGVLTIILGAKLLKINDNPYGLFRPLAYALIVTGVAYATVVLSPVGLIAGIIVDILLARIFFRAAKSISGSNRAGQGESNATA